MMMNLFITTSTDTDTDTSSLLLALLAGDWYHHADFLLVLPVIANIMKWVSYFVIAALFVQYRSLIYTKEQRQNHDDWITEHKKTIYTIHGFAVYIYLYIFQGLAVVQVPKANGGIIGGEDEEESLMMRNYMIEIILYVTMIPFAILLWDFGDVFTDKKKAIMILGGFHHIGVLLVLPYHIYESNPIVASRTTNMFGWLWLAHSFSFIQKIILKLLLVLGVNKDDKAVRKDYAAFDRMRELYAIMTVSFMYSYYYGEQQPGIGWNYQTVALTIMISGRYILCHGFTSWIRYIEVPGAIVLYMTSILSSCVGGEVDDNKKNINFYYGIAGTVGLYLLALIWNVVLKSQTNCPSKWDPKHPKIASILSTYGDKCVVSPSSTTCEFPDGLSPGIATSRKSPDHVTKTFNDHHPELEEKYPAIMAVSSNDVQKLQELIKHQQVLLLKNSSNKKKKSNNACDDDDVDVDDIDAVDADADADADDEDDDDDVVDIVLEESNMLFTNKLYFGSAATWAAHLGRVHCFILLLKAGLNPWNENEIWKQIATENIIPLMELKAELEPIALELFPPISSETTLESIFERCVKIISEF